MTASSNADRLRRAADVAAATVGLALSAPLIGAAALAIRATMGRGVFYVQQRNGLHGQPFGILKLRTMRAPQPGRDATEYDNERLTALGRFLRSTSVDELPTFVNLLRGDLTLVGPRPLPTAYWPRYTPAQRRRFEVKPGITGLSQVNGRNAMDWSTRLRYDVHYVDTRSLAGDLRILARTIPTVLSRRGVESTDGVPMAEFRGDHPPDGTAAAPDA